MALKDHVRGPIHNPKAKAIGMDVHKDNLALPPMVWSPRGNLLVSVQRSGHDHCMERCSYIPVSTALTHR
jgi:hypothetical protein